jgi:starch phosphorylase
MKAAMKELCPYFNTNRMVREYATRFYMPSVRCSLALEAEDMARAKALAEWEAKLQQNWDQLRVVSVDTDAPPDILQVGSQLEVSALIHLGELQPDDVTVELYHGPLDSRGEIAPAEVTPLRYVAAKEKNGNCLYRGAIPFRFSGRYGYTLRLLPHHEDLSDPHKPGLILWAGE